VKGNHDFISLSDWIGGDVWEVDEDASRTTNIMGLKVGGCRGINYIAGEWSDELSRTEFSARAGTIPTDIDVLLTHSPPEGIFDRPPPDPGTPREHQLGWGSLALASWLNRRIYYGTPLRAHLFGHVHDFPGVKKTSGTVFSNAATTCNLIDL
jgi:Icc-related predicted phosphoesterase